MGAGCAEGGLSSSARPSLGSGAPLGLDLLVEERVELRFAARFFPGGANVLL